MAKGINLNSKFRGKLGAVVYSVNTGVQIAREYNPQVKNPNTVSQMNQRSRLKLASQLAAALAPVVAIPREGLVSPRNLFIKGNMDFISANNGEAMISYENIQLTKGVAGLPAVKAARESSNINIELVSDASKSISRVVYIVYAKTSEDQLQYIDSVVTSEAGENGTFPVSVADFVGDVILWAYGIKDNSSSATAKYGNYSVNTGEDIAQLVISRKLAAGDYQFTQTRGTTLFEGEESTTDATPSQNLVYITASGPGTVSGTGFTGNRKAVNKGESVTVTATPDSGAEFVGWRLNGKTQTISTSREYTFVPTTTTDLVAVFNKEDYGDMGG